MSDADPLEDITYLIGSPNRILVLQSLGNDPQSSAALQDITDASRVTIGRILDGFQQRGWVARHDDQYVLTDLGERVLAGYGELYDAVATTQSLLSVWWWLPREELDFDLTLLSDASITFSQEHDRFRTLRAFGDLIADSTHVRIVSPSLDYETLNQLTRAADWDTHQLDAIISTRMMEVIEADPELSSAFEKLVGPSESRIYLCDDELPNYVLGVVDDVALLHLFDGEGVPRALITCTQRDVLEWANEQVETYRQDAELVIDV